MLDHFLLIRKVEFLGTSAGFTVRKSRISSFFYAYHYLTNPKHQHSVASNKGQPTMPLKALALIYLPKSPQNAKCSKTEKLSAAGNITPLVEDEANHSLLLWTTWSSAIFHT